MEKGVIINANFFCEAREDLKEKESAQEAVEKVAQPAQKADPPAQKPEEDFPF